MDTVFLFPNRQKLQAHFYSFERIQVYVRCVSIEQQKQCDFDILMVCFS